MGDFDQIPKSSKEELEKLKGRVEYSNDCMRGRGASYMGRRDTARYFGLYTRENVGMSSERQVRILPAENPRFPEEGSSAQG